jgi:hypothetical protein
MAKKKNSASAEDREARAPVSIKATLAGMERTQEAIDGQINFKLGGWTDDGARIASAAVPAELMDTLMGVIAGEREWGRWRLVHPELDPLSRARLGEFEPLIRHFEGGGNLTEKERRTLAMIARGVFPRMGRPPETETEMRNREIARFAKILKLYRGRRVYDVTARKFDIDRSYVPKLMKKYPDEATVPYLVGCLLSSMGADQKTVWKVVLACAGIAEDDIREASGRRGKKKIRK